MSNSTKMWALAASFPTLAKWATAHASEDFAGDRILEALDEPWVTTGSRFALLFVADVWNSDMREWLPEHLQRWSIADAFASWDDEHRAAARTWFARPWWP